MKNLLLIILFIISPSLYAVDTYNAETGSVQIPAVIAGQETYAVTMQHQGDLEFQVTFAITVPATSSNPDIYDLETEILYMPTVNVGTDSYEVYMSHQGDLVFKVTSAIKIETGRFIDSAVEGLSFKTETRHGSTNTNGEFSYLAGETVVFGLGDLEFPAVTAAQILTPLELAGTQDINQTGVVNMARLLQSLDKDCNPDNGISISGEVLLAAAGMSLDFESPNFDAQVANLVANGGQENSSCKVLVPSSQAVSHLQNTLNDLNNQTNPPIGNGLIGKVGVWEGEGQQTGISWTIRIDIQNDTQLIEYPSLNCGGFLTLLEESDTQLLFKETLTFGFHICGDHGFVELTDQSENELVYRYYWPDSNGQKGELGAIGSVTKIQ